MTLENRHRLFFVLSDLVGTALAWLVFNIIRFYNLAGLMPGITLWQFLGFRDVIVGQFLFPLLMIAIFFLGGFYNDPLYKSRLEAMLNTLACTLIGTILIFFIAVIDDPIPDRASNYELLVWMWALLFTLVMGGRYAIITISRAKIRTHSWCINTLVVGASDTAEKLCERLERSSVPHGLRICGMVEIPGEGRTRRRHSWPVYPLASLAELCRQKRIAKLIVATSNGADGSSDLTLPLISSLFPLDLPIMVAPSRLSIIAARQRMRDVVGEPLVDISAPSMSPSTANLKRAGDIVVSFLALLLLSPLFAAIALAIRRDGPGPVFYRQERVGYHKRLFWIWKFRTMRPDAEDHGPQLSCGHHDPRITPVGRFLRKYRLDELPQFWNVLRGDMSLVGPRPEREFYIRQIVQRVPYYTLVHQLRPGITSWGMVKHGYASSVDQMIDRFHFDLIYLENVSFPVDLKILFYTIRTVLTGQGI